MSNKFINRTNRCSRCCIYDNMINNYIGLIIDELTEEEKQFLISIIFKILNNLEKKPLVKISESSKENTIRQIDIE